MNDAKPTAETDALHEDLVSRAGPAAAYFQMRDLARRLERERDEARRQWSLHQDKGAELHLRVRELEANLCSRCTG